ncbi:MAG: hypothetical protein AB1697_05970 [Pseudomonadota bacterium]
MKKLLVLGLSLLLTACASVSKVGPGEVSVKDQLSARLDSAWNKVALPNNGKSEFWTTDGVTLDSLVFYVGIAEGEPLAEQAGRQDKQQARFRANMPAHEVVELYGSVISEGGNSFKLDRLAPAVFLGGDGFRFEYTLLRKGDEVELKGVAYGAVRNGKLYLMTFQAPRLHYFKKHLGRVEAVAASLKLRG